ncbi:Flagellar motor rotation protein MotA [Caldisalinibacter kiritimatiensis]|uniref:Flagellar motor rotation protein MotA n=1 Tax=Caldisalinibacter kiritimatiensis TaxID=1304284 RepID=R1ARC7_9FIRM|nr:flagellar motor protein [Caldisalinibacter kiritimatiensis]EOC99712.1 Flagellar motor rotation protein MotA [Caldisalinibacter kiritimatiensis]
MDLATLIGLISGFLFIIIGVSTGSGNVMSFLHPASILIVLGGTIAATFVSFPIKKVLSTFKVVKNVFVNKTFSPNEIIQQIIRLANVARKEGLLALEEAAEDIDDEFLKKGILLIVDGTDPELVRNILETELAFLEERHSQGQGIFEAMGTYSPAFGMIGTLIGLISMLRDISDTSSIGPNMSTALITTFYGTLFANLIFLPISNKLKGKSKEEIILKELMVEGLLSIQAGENPRIIEEKLKTFLAPDVRKTLNNEPEREEA